MAFLDTFKQNKYEFIGAIVFLLIGIICTVKINTSPADTLVVNDKATGKKQGLIAGMVLGYGIFVVLVGMVYFD
jgi:uncharacterized membrane protein